MPRQYDLKYLLPRLIKLYAYTRPLTLGLRHTPCEIVAETLAVNNVSSSWIETFAFAWLTASSFRIKPMTSSEGDPSFAQRPYPFARVPRQHRIRMLVRSIQRDRTTSIRGPSRAADPQLERPHPNTTFWLASPGSEGRLRCGENGILIGTEPTSSIRTSNSRPDRQLHTRCDPRDFSNGWNARRRFSSTTNTHGWVVTTLTKPVFVRFFTRPAFNRGRGRSFEIFFVHRDHVPHMQDATHKFLRPSYSDAFRFSRRIHSSSRAPHHLYSALSALRS